MFKVIKRINDYLRKPQPIERQASRFISFFVIPLCIVVILSGLISVHQHIDQTNSAFAQISSYFIKEIDTNFEQTSMYLAQTSNSDFNFFCLAHIDNDPEYYLHKRRLYLTLQDDIDFYPYVQYFFTYHVNNEDIMLVPASSRSFQSSTLSHEEMQKGLLDFIGDRNTTLSSWRLVTIAEEQYLLRLLRYNHIYFGACVPIQTLTDKMANYDLGNSTVRVIQEAEVYRPAKTDIGLRSILNDEFLLPSETGDFALQFTIDWMLLYSRHLRIQLGVVFFSFLLLLMIPLSKKYLKWQITEPVQKIVEHMQLIQGGNMDAALSTDFSSHEMSFVAGALNRMVSQINTLKISVYETQITQQALEMQCLTLQLNPHFFLNTLNYIYVLSRNKQQEQLQEVIINFTRYFRSIFQSDVDTIPLLEEVERCRNYTSIYSIRSAKCFSVDYHMSDDVFSYQVPHMCILTFVENSVKYAHEDIGLLTITVSAVLEKTHDEEERLEITIGDNGIGFPAAIMENFNRLTANQSVTQEGGHIGIRNLIQRMNLLYLGHAKIHFSNSSSGGAIVRISLPPEPKSPSTKLLPEGCEPS